MYLATKDLKNVSTEIAALEPCPWTGKIEPDQVLAVLCERLDIWPASIAPDVEADG